jgi:hypothetical protein
MERHPVLPLPIPGVDDLAFLAGARTQNYLLVTPDSGFGDVRADPPGSHDGIAPCASRVRSDDRCLTPFSLTTHHDLEDFRGCIVIVRGHLLGVRRPS